MSIFLNHQKSESHQLSYVVYVVYREIVTRENIRNLNLPIQCSWQCIRIFLFQCYTMV